LVVVSSKTQMWLLYCFEICTSTFYSIFIIGLTVLSLNNFPDTYCTMFYPIPKMKMPLWNLRDLPLFAWLFASLVWVCVVVFHNFWQHYQFFLLDFPKMKFFFFLVRKNLPRNAQWNWYHSWSCSWFCDPFLLAIRPWLCRQFRSLGTKWYVILWF
jgi:hypothetical protein